MSELMEFETVVMFEFSGKKFKQSCIVGEMQDELPPNRFYYINTTFMDLVFSVERDDFVKREYEARIQLVAKILDYMKRQQAIELKKLERWNSGAGLSFVR